MIIRMHTEKMFLSGWRLDLGLHILPRHGILHYTITVVDLNNNYKNNLIKKHYTDELV